MIVAGIDGGSRTIKVVLLDTASETVLASGACDQGVRQEALAAALLDRLLGGIGRSQSDVKRIVATGYARHRIGIAQRAITEITCHAVGVRRQMPGAMTILEMGGQDSKLIRLDGDGLVRDFSMNDRCAAGTGRFLEVVAARLEVCLQDLGPLAASSQSPANISSTCVVFAESEIIGLLAGGVCREDIVAGVQRSMAQRIAAMAAGNPEEPIVFTGGVALVTGMKAALETALGKPLMPASDPLMTGALGAAILAGRMKE
ncbi:MAG: acyl-CoA dehydratase activase [Tepidisphaeraceae bacterium]|jgi:predicted CoA-substrate-specific enzyme activase